MDLELKNQQIVNIHVAYLPIMDLGSDSAYDLFFLDEKIIINRKRCKIFIVIFSNIIIVKLTEHELKLAAAAFYHRNKETILLRMRNHRLAIKKNQNSNSINSEIAAVVKSD